MVSALHTNSVFAVRAPLCQCMSLPCGNQRSLVSLFRDIEGCEDVCNTCPLLLSNSLFNNTAQEKFVSDNLKSVFG